MFALDKAVIAAISPLGTALLALAVAALARRRWPRSAFGLAAAGWLWLLLCSTPAFSNLLVGAVEGSVPWTPLAALPALPAAVVLGGGIDPAQVPGQLPHLNDAGDRIWYGARLYHAGKAPLLVLSGGRDTAIDLGTEAQAMRELLLDLGVPDHALLIEQRSRTTRENARFVAPMLAARGIHRVLLVTSALHMRRALALFRAQGLDPVPAATDFEARRLPSAEQWLPDPGALQRSAWAIKETAGWLAGR